MFWWGCAPHPATRNDSPTCRAEHEQPKTKLFLDRPILLNDAKPCRAPPRCAAPPRLRRNAETWPNAEATPSLRAIRGCGPCRMESCFGGAAPHTPPRAATCPRAGLTRRAEHEQPKTKLFLDRPIMLDGAKRRRAPPRCAAPPRLRRNAETWPNAEATPSLRATGWLQAIGECDVSWRGPAPPPPQATTCPRAGPRAGPSMSIPKTPYSPIGPLCWMARSHAEHLRVAPLLRV